MFRLSAFIQMTLSALGNTRIKTENNNSYLVDLSVSHTVGLLTCWSMCYGTEVFSLLQCFLRLTQGRALDR